MHQPPGFASRRCQPFICLPVVPFVFLASHRPPGCASRLAQFFTNVLYLTVASTDPSKFPGFGNRFDSHNSQLLVGFLTALVALFNRSSCYCSGSNFCRCPTPPDFNRRFPSILHWLLLFSSRRARVILNVCRFSPVSFFSWANFFSYHRRHVHGILFSRT